jgi:hypothetical protein
MNLFDLDLKSDAEAGFKMLVKHPVTNKDTDCTISVVGSDSKVYRKARADSIREAMKKGGDIDTDEASAEIYAKCITGWIGMSGPDGEIKYSEEKALELLMRFSWLCDQLGIVIESRLNFTKPLKKS